MAFLLDTVSLGHSLLVGGPAHPTAALAPFLNLGPPQFFQPLNVRVVLVGLEAWTQHDLIEMSANPAALLDNFLRWRRTDLLPRLPHDSAQLVT